MKNIILISAILLTIGCGKKVGMKDVNQEMMKQGMRWDADIKILKLEVEHLKADVKRLQEDNNASSARTTPPMKNIVGSYVGSYEIKGEKIDCKVVFFENAKAAWYDNVEKQGAAVTWKIVGKEVHVGSEKETGVFKRRPTNF